MVEATHKRQLARAVGVISLFTLLSRLLGFIRDVVTAQVFGAGMGADAFFVAQKLPNFLRRLFAEGAFNTAFIPVFSDYLARGEPEQTRRAAQAVFTMLLVVLIGVVVAVQLVMPLLILVIAPGFSSQPEKYELTVFLTRITFPYILLVSLVALAGGILNTHRRFALPAATPIFLNLCMIIGSLWLADWFDPPITGLALGLLLGGVVQLAIQFPALKRLGIPFRLHWEPDHPAIRRVLTLMGPSLLGVSVAQVSLLFDIFLASWLPEGSISYLYYADRLMEFPLGLIAIAMGTAILTTLSAKAAVNDLPGVRHDLEFGMRLVAVVNLPASIGLVVLSEPIVSLLFERGEFSVAATTLTARALVAFSLGLMGFSAVKVIAPAFYAMKDTKTPMKIAITCLVINMIMNVILMFPFQHVGLALSTTLTAYLNSVLLIRALDRKIGFTLGGEFTLTVVKSLVAGGVMGIFLYLGSATWWSRGMGTAIHAALIAGLIGGGMLLYVATAKLLRMRELDELFHALSRQRGGPGGA